MGRAFADLIGLGAFVVYSTWAAFRATYTLALPVAVLLTRDLWRFAACAVGPNPSWIPAWLPFSPALLYFGRRAVSIHLLLLSRSLLQAMWADRSRAPSSSRVITIAGRTFPLIIQNIHRYFLYIALAFLLFSHTTRGREWFLGADGKQHFGIARTIVLTANVSASALHI